METTLPVIAPGPVDSELMLLVSHDDQRLDETLAALANSTRRAILARLAQSEATVNELAEPFDLTLPAVSKHIKVLLNAGLVEQGRRAQFRPCRLEPAPLAAVASWIDQYRPIWEDRLDRLGDYLETVQGTRPTESTSPNQQETNHD